jgi:hypothetical protein
MPAYSWTRISLWVRPPRRSVDIGNIWVSQAGDYYEITDSLPVYEESSHGELVGNK